MAGLSDVTIGLPACDDDPRVLSLALDAIAEQGVAAPPVVVDMSATDQIARAVRAHPEKVHYVSFPASAGVADSRNLIVDTAQTRYVLFLDADAVPLPGWAEAAAGAFDAGDRVAMVGTRIVPAWPRPAPPLFTTAIAQELLGMLDVGTEARTIPRVMGTSYAVDRELLPRSPPFETDLGRRPGRLLAWEEVRLSLDVAAAGGLILYEPRAAVRHHVRVERLSWRWMLRRAHVAGRESRLWPLPLDPFPRPLTLRDRLFQIATSPAFLTGRLRGAGR